MQYLSGNYAIKNFTLNALSMISFVWDKEFSDGYGMWKYTVFVKAFKGDYLRASLREANKYFDVSVE